MLALVLRSFLIAVFNILEYMRKMRNRVVNFEISFEDGDYDFDLSSKYWTNNELLDIQTTKGAEIAAGMWVHLIQ